MEASTGRPESGCRLCGWRPVARQRWHASASGGADAAARRRTPAYSSWSRGLRPRAVHHRAEAARARKVVDAAVVVCPMLPDLSTGEQQVWSSSAAGSDSSGSTDSSSTRDSRRGSEERSPPSTGGRCSFVHGPHQRSVVKRAWAGVGDGHRRPAPRRRRSRPASRPGRPGGWAVPGVRQTSRRAQAARQRPRRPGRREQRGAWRHRPPPRRVIIFQRAAAGCRRSATSSRSGPRSASELQRHAGSGRLGLRFLAPAVGACATACTRISGAARCRPDPPSAQRAAGRHWRSARAPAR